MVIPLRPLRPMCILYLGCLLIDCSDYNLLDFCGLNNIGAESLTFWKGFRNQPRFSYTEPLGLVQDQVRYLQPMQDLLMEGVGPWLV